MPLSAAAASQDASDFIFMAPWIEGRRADEWGRRWALRVRGEQKRKHEATQGWWRILGGTCS